MRTTRLAAILFVDLEGFGDRLARDEPAALEALRAWRALADPLAAEQGGEIVDATGDELLLVFDSAVAAVQYALHLRLSLRARNASLAPAERFLPRVGIHLGEIWRDEGRVYGNGVNLAARVKAEAAGGSILVSEDLERQVSGKLDLVLRELPPRGLKNIERPLRLYEIEPAAAAAERPVAEARRGVEAGPGAARPVHHHVPPPPPLPAPKPKSGKAVKRVTLEGGRIQIDYVSEEQPSPHSPPSAGKEGVGRKPVVITLPRASLEDRRAEARKAVVKGIEALVRSALLGGALAWAWTRWDSLWLLVAAGLAGALPAVSALKKLVVGAFELGELEREERKRLD